MSSATADLNAPNSPATLAGGSLKRFVRGHNHVTLYLGDCLDVLPIEADAVITDPPYGVAWNTKYEGKEGTLTFSHVNGSAPYAKNMVRKKHAPIIGDDKPFDPTPWLKYKIVAMFGANNFSDKLPQGSWLVWDKRDAMENAFMSQAEAAWLNSGKSIRLMKHCWQGFSRASENSEHYHPTQKPVAVMAWVIREAKVPEGGTVLDPYMGSGTTGIAAIRLGMNFVGVEKDPEHFKTACARLEAECNQGALL